MILPFSTRRSRTSLISNCLYWASLTPRTMFSKSMNIASFRSSLIPPLRVYRFGRRGCRFEARQSNGSRQRPRPPVPDPRSSCPSGSTRLPDRRVPVLGQYSGHYRGVTVPRANLGGRAVRHLYVRGSLEAEWARDWMAGQSLALTRSVGAIQEPPT